MNNLCTDIGFRSVNKYGEELCGDSCQSIKLSDGSVVAVLADGLGSGVKANILSTLTSKIISTMIANNLSIEDCVETIIHTLPVCEVRHVAYSTFTIVRIIDNEEAEMFQFDNPHIILLRDGKNLDYGMTSLSISGKIVYKSKISLFENDVLILMSDGMIYAGVGQELNFGWQRDNIISFIEEKYENELSAKSLATILLDKSLELYKDKPGDDTTALVMKINERKTINLLIGPPAHKEEDQIMLSTFFNKGGKHIVCGGTTSNIVGKYLNKPVQMDLSHYTREVPPTAIIEGVDLVTEGVITINKVLEYAKDYLDSNFKKCVWNEQEDGASLIARLLFEEATDINFYVGQAINPAHQNPDLPINFSIKMKLIEQLVDCLKKMGKNINVSYF